MTASYLIIHQIRSLVEAGKTKQEVAEIVVLSVRQVERVMRAYDIKPRRPISVPPRPLHKLIGGR